MINVAICGINGKMGKNLCELIACDSEINLACGVDILPSIGAKPPVYARFEHIKEQIDAVIDFSSPAVLRDELEYARKNNCAVVLASTGYSKEDLKLIDESAKSIPVFKTANFSLGVNLLVKLVRRAAEVLGESFDAEIIERHHNQKADAPSGTALMLADGIAEAFEGGKEYVNGRDGIVGKRGKEIGLHAVRGGTIVGEHEVMFAGEDEIISFSHSARSKKVFAVGAIKAAKWVAGKPAGKYDMTDLLENL